MPFGETVKFRHNALGYDWNAKHAVADACIQMFLQGEKVLTLERGKLLRPGLDGSKIGVDFLQTKDGRLRQTICQPKSNKIATTLYLPVREFASTKAGGPKGVHEVGQVFDLPCIEGCKADLASA